MYGYPTRREKHNERVEAFLDDEFKKTMELRLYNREIPILESENPGIIVMKGKPYKDTALFTCTILKR